MTVSEFNLWLKYARKHGSLNPNKHIDNIGARITYMIHAANGGKSKFADFVIKYGESEEHEEVGADEFVRRLALTGRVVYGRR